MDKNILLSFALLSISTACPIWTVQTSSQCICGDSLKGVVDCSLYPYQVSVLGCYCMTYNDKISKVTVGRCLITCQGWHLMHEIQSKEPHQLNDEVCGHLNRTGQLCGDCVPGHAHPVHSYSLKCVHCDERDFAYNLAKYVFFAFFPLTILYIIVILWKVSITSHKMVAFVFTCQIMTSPYLLQMLTEKITKNFFLCVLCVLPSDNFVHHSNPLEGVHHLTQNGGFRFHLPDNDLAVPTANANRENNQELLLCIVR